MRRFSLSREFHIPAGACKLAAKDGSVTIYTYTSAGLLCAVAFLGKADKPAWRLRFATEERRQLKIASTFANARAHADAIRARRAAANAGHTFKVGDIITNTWGYDQTNVDFYRVVRTSRVFVWLQPLTAGRTEIGELSMSGTSAPSADADKPVEKHKASGESVSMEFGVGRKWDNTPQRVSWYH